MKIAYLKIDMASIGGLERIICQKMNWLAANAYDVYLITTDSRGEAPCYPIDSQIKQIDLDVNYNAQKHRGLLKRIFYFFLNNARHKKRLKKELKSICPDVVISTFGNDMSVLSAMKLNAKKVLEYHGTKKVYTEYQQVKGFRGLIDRLMIRAMYRQIKKFDKFVILSQHELSEWAMPNAIAIPNSINIQAVEQRIKKKKVIAVGRLSPEKDFQSLIDIWSFVVDRLDGWTLEIYGEGPEKEGICERISTLGLDDSIRLHGFTDNLSEIYGDASLLLLTSLHEGFGMVLVEAHHFGVPTIAYKCGGGVSEVIIPDQNGYIIPERDNKLYCDKVISVLTNPDLLERLSKGAVTLSKRYDEATVMRKWTQLFENIVG